MAFSIHLVAICNTARQAATGCGFRVRVHCVCLWLAVINDHRKALLRIDWLTIVWPCSNKMEWDQWRELERDREGDCRKLELELEVWNPKSNAGEISRSRSNITARSYQLAANRCKQTCAMKLKLSLKR